MDVFSALRKTNWCEMDKDSNCREGVCVVHFEGKEGQIKYLTQETLYKIVERREQWLSLSSEYKNFTKVAKKSLELIPGREQRESLNINDIPKNYFYHSACYRNFTDISKFERAEKTLRNISRKRQGDSPIKEEVKATPIKVPRTTRKSFSTARATSASGSSSVLPKSCLICKQPGPIFFTDTVFSSLYINLYLCFIN